MYQAITQLMEARRWCGNVELVMRLHENMFGSVASYLCVHNSRIVNQPNLRWEVQRRHVLCACMTNDLSLYRTVPSTTFDQLHSGGYKRCRLSWLTNSGLVYELKCRGGGGGGVRVHSQLIQLCTMHIAHGAQINFGDLTPYLTYACNLQERSAKHTS